MMTRKAFQELQTPSVTSRNTSKMGGAGENIIKESVDGNASIRSKKPNTVPAKRPRRKYVGTENKPKKTSKEVTSKSTAKTGKTKACVQKEDSDMQRTVTLNQSRLESYLCPSTSVISDDSAVQDLGITCDITLNISKDRGSKDHNLLTSETPSEAYWQMIAEQRKIAHEKTVLENEMIADEIFVLQAENMQLKSARDAAETLLKQLGLLD